MQLRGRDPDGSEDPTCRPYSDPLPRQKPSSMKPQEALYVKWLYCPRRMFPTRLSQRITGRSVVSPTGFEPVLLP
jgi:hypothetical protein